MNSRIAVLRGVRGGPHNRLAMLGRVAAAVDDLAIIVAAGDGSITAWNLGAQRLFGYQESEMMGRALSDIEHAGTQAACSRATMCSLDEPGWIEQHRCYRHKSGRRIYCRCRLMSLDEAGDGTRAWLVRDASSGAAGRAAPGLADDRPEPVVVADPSPDHCLAMMSHELKQPLTALLLNLERLLERAAEMDFHGAQSLGRTMRDSVRRQARVIDDLFDLSRMRNGKLRLDPVMADLDQIVRAVASDVALGAPDRKLRVEVDTSFRYRCMADPVRLEQMLSNLLNNAVKFTGSGGRIEVRVASIEGFAKVSVADDGCGISAEFLPHVFRMFGQERRADSPDHSGMGIGLALVRELAEAHGGKVEARSNGVGQGAAFTIWLPLPPSPAARRG
jgi:two-component system CheB/CheR fusion protein